MSDREEDIVTVFQQRRTRMMKSFGVAMLLVALSLGLKMISDQWPSFLGISNFHWNALAVAQFVSAAFFAIRGFRQYKCPVCDEIPKGHDMFYLGVSIDPEKCPHCGTRLS